MKKYIMPAIGVAAFIIGGLVTRTKALEMAETLERTFHKKDDLELDQ